MKKKLNKIKVNSMKNNYNKKNNKYKRSLKISSNLIMWKNQNRLNK